MVAHIVTDDISQELPKEVRIAGSPAFSPNELRVLKAQTGRTLESIMSDEVDAVQAMVWLALRDEGHNPSWEDAGDVRGEMAPPEVDPSTRGD